jgi:hypothetical protein
VDGAYGVHDVGFVEIDRDEVDLAVGTGGLPHLEELVF